MDAAQERSDAQEELMSLTGAKLNQAANSQGQKSEIPDLTPESQEERMVGRTGSANGRQGNGNESKHAESRIRVITLEAARLRKELRDVETKRQRVSERCQEYEEKSRWAEKAVSELRYSNKQLQGELKLASEAAAASATRNRAALASLRAGLSAVEQAVAERAAKSHTQLQGLFSALQSIQRLVLQRASVPAGDLLEVQRLFAEIVQGLATLSSLIGGGLRPLVPPLSASEPPTPAAPPASAKEQVVHVALAAELLVLKQRMASVESERARLSAEAASLREELARERSSESVKASALIPQYRTAVVKARAQASAFREQIADGARERAVLREEVENLQRTLQERSSAQEAEQQREALQSARALSEASAAREKLEADAKLLRKRLAKWEEDGARWAVERESLLLQSGELELQCKQHRTAVRELRAILSDQRADAQSALELVSKRPSSFFSANPPFALPKPGPGLGEILVRPATASAVYETFGQGPNRTHRHRVRERETWELQDGLGRHGLGNVGVTDGLGAGEDLGTSPSTTGRSLDLGEGLESRHHYHRSRRRRERDGDRKPGYASVPNPVPDSGVARGERELGSERRRADKDGFKLGKEGVRLEERGFADDRRVPVVNVMGGFQTADVNMFNGQDGRRGEAHFPGAYASLQSVPGLGVNAGGDQNRPSVDTRLSGVAARSNGGGKVGTILDDLLLTETDSERGSLGVGPNQGGARGLIPGGQMPSVGQWPSRALEEVAAAFAQPSDNKPVGNKDSQVGGQENASNVGERTYIGKDGDVAALKGPVAAAGSEELQRGMAALDEEIADLQTSLQVASWRLKA